MPYIKSAYIAGREAALAKFSSRDEQIRLKIHNRTYHGVDQAFKAVSPGAGVPHKKENTK